jgi:hypothetical protein
MRILHVLDHSIPLHSGYTFRTAAILREQRASAGKPSTSPRPSRARPPPMEEVDGLRFYRCAVPPAGPAGINEWRLMRATERASKPSPASCARRDPRPFAGAQRDPGDPGRRRLGIPVVYEIRAFWEDAAVDHGTTEGSLRYRATRALETWAIKRVDHVFTICEGLRRDIVARGVPEAG